MVETNTVPKIPDFLSKEFFKKCLQHGLETKDIEIEDVRTSLGSLIGENYMSTVYRTEIKYHQSNKDTQDISLIVKVMLMNIEKIEEIDAFKREVEMYTVILPKIEKLYKNIETFVPKCFHVENTPEYQAIVIQDLKPFGYSIADRVQRLSEEHSEIVLKKLGRYHAGTIVLYEKEPEVFKPFDMGIFQSTFVEHITFQGIFFYSLTQFTEYVSKWEGFEKITMKLRKLLENFNEKCKQYLTLKPNEIRVLNHSDLWTNNLMFKYENGNVTSVKFIDLQISTNDNLGCDINYFFSTSVDFDVLKNKRDELIKCYYGSFHQSLKELQYSNIPSLEAVQNSVKSREFFGFIAAVGIAPIILLDRDESKDSTMETLADANEITKKRASTFSNPKYEDFMKYSLKRYDELGIFD